MTETAARTTQAPDPHTPHTPWQRATLMGVVLSAVVCLVVLAFSWPLATLSPKDVPIAISGPAQALAPVEKALDQNGGGAFRLVEVGGRDEAVQQIKTRHAYGAIILGPQPEVLTASAAGAATSAIMTQLHTQVQTMAQQQAAAAAKAGGQPAPTVTVPLTDVAPLVSTDTRGVGLASAALPLVFGGMIGGVGIAFTVAGAWRRVAALFVYGVVGGLAIAGIMQSWLGFIGGNYWAVAGAFGLTLLAMGATIVGFASLFGRAGIAVGPVLFMLIGNPISGAQFPKEFITSPWGAIGQWLPPGAGNSLLRDAAYFPEADPSFPILVLAGWAALGLTLVIAGHFRDQGRLVVEENPEDHAG